MAMPMTVGPSTVDEIAVLEDGSPSLLGRVDGSVMVGVYLGDPAPSHRERPHTRPARPDPVHHVCPGEAGMRSRASSSSNGVARARSPKNAATSSMEGRLMR